MPVPGAGEVLTRTIWLSIDPYMRGRMSERRVLCDAGGDRRRDDRRDGGRGDRQQDPGFAPGDFVVGSRGWQTHTVSQAAALAKVDRARRPARQPISACSACRAPPPIRG